MLDVAPTELLLVALVALVVIGPKDLPRAMRFVGQWVARARGVARHFRSGIDEMIRQAELEEMEKKWKAENERIMREHPPQPLPADGEMLPLGAPQDGGAAEMTAPETATPAAPEASPSDRPPAPQQP
ncbi:twin-arginine translocase subunit TatB [Sphingomonas histidinilytica]|jgi:sec-independent protein translocase protein TatB|uniref:Sec-independent protein translocase protein TatB n=1 Tax=Rhizorhabdus histidinilytica TaxID=439228 RepID=A0A1T5B198_9SPHN|nr:Sec-independent protein translocase protein TatB [Rhizorhabdus histidinilytica]MBO9377822.1 twin-arginine translocase subunit TatB [Rhizorhabdus histidinilytica]QEH79469.1 twin-arginine translocase subunit TatB [Sphingomonas sp. C8-2]SKB40847.1 sec-independent protein translocase protein TatB [Rhizorhabdus histidinilytica]